MEFVKKLPLINFLNYFQKTKLNDRGSGATLSRVLVSIEVDLGSPPAIEWAIAEATAPGLRLPQGLEHRGGC